MRILYLSANRIGKGSWVYDLFGRALSKYHDVIFYGKNFGVDYNGHVPIPDVIKQYRQKIDFIFVNMGYSFLNLEQVTDIPKIHLLGDYGRSPIGSGISTKNYDRYLEFYKYDLIFGYSKFICSELQRKKLAPHIHYLPFGVDTYIYCKKDAPRIFDIVAAYSNRRSMYPLRKDIQNKIAEMKGVKYSFAKISTWDDVDRLNKTKIVVNGNHTAGGIGPRYTQVLACGTFFLTDAPSDLEAHGYIDGKHLVIFDGMEDLERKIRYYLKHEEEREKIAKNGMEFVRKNYSNEKIVEKFIGIIKSDLF